MPGYKSPEEQVLSRLDCLIREHERKKMIEAVSTEESRILIKQLANKAQAIQAEALLNRPIEDERPPWESDPVLALDFEDNDKEEMQGRRRVKMLQVKEDYETAKKSYDDFLAGAKDPPIQNDNNGDAPSDNRDDSPDERKIHSPKSHTSPCSKDSHDHEASPVDSPMDIGPDVHVNCTITLPNRDGSPAHEGKEIVKSLDLPFETSTPFVGRVSTEKIDLHDLKESLGFNIDVEPIPSNTEQSAEVTIVLPPRGGISFALENTFEVDSSKNPDDEKVDKENEAVNVTYHRESIGANATIVLEQECEVNLAPPCIAQPASKPSTLPVPRAITAPKIAPVRRRLKSPVKRVPPSTVTSRLPSASALPNKPSGAAASSATRTLARPSSMVSSGMLPRMARTLSKRE